MTWIINDTSEPDMETALGESLDMILVIEHDKYYNSLWFTLIFLWQEMPGMLGFCMKYDTDIRVIITGNN